MVKKTWSKKGVRFLTVGVINTLFDLAILNTLVFAFHVPILIANLISASISITTSYFLNHYIVFRSKDPHSFPRFARFFFVTGFGILAIQTAVIYVVLKLLEHFDTIAEHVVSYSHLPNLTTKAVELNIAKLTAVLAAMIWNFTIYHYVIFKTETEATDTPD